MGAWLGVFLLPAYLVVAWVQFDITMAARVVLFGDMETVTGKVVGYEEKLRILPASRPGSWSSSRQKRGWMYAPVVRFETPGGFAVKFTSPREFGSRVYPLNAEVPVVYPVGFPGSAVIYSFGWPGGRSLAVAVLLVAMFSAGILIVHKREQALGSRVPLVKDYSPSLEFKHALLLAFFIVAAVVVVLAIFPYVEPWLPIQ